MENIEIALAANDGYFPGLLVTAYSIYTFASSDVVLSFHILDVDITDEHWEQLEKALHRYTRGPVVKLSRHKISEASFPDTWPNWNGNKVAYARFLLPDLLPDCDHVIYCDVDFLWLADIVYLWEHRKTGALVYAVSDIPQTVNKVNKWMREHSLQEFSSYFNSGLSIYNLCEFCTNL